MKPLLQIKEVIVVEGKNDITAVKNAVKATCIATLGWRFDHKLLTQLKEIQEQSGIIVLMDPDTTGENLRKRIKMVIPNAKHAFITKAEAMRKDNIGVENASPEVIKEALLKARSIVSHPIEQPFTMADLFINNLVGCPSASENREKIAKILGIGYANAKNFLERLNNFGIKKEEFKNALLELEKDKPLKY